MDRLRSHTIREVYIMKKITTLFLIEISGIFISDCRGFNGYGSDGNGGSIRTGLKTYIIYTNMKYAEHCKANNTGALSCSALDVKFN